MQEVVLLERAAKVVLVVSVTMAVALAAWLGSWDWPPLLLVTAAAAVGGYVAGRYALGGAVLAVGYLVPILFVVTLGRYYYPYLTVWTAAVLGAVLSRSPRTSWSLPPAWRAPLLLWALVVSLSWPVVVLRELDFTPALLNVGRGTGNSFAGGLPREAVQWVVNMVVVQGVGLLWLDRLCADFSSDDLRRFARRVLAPLGMSAVLAALVGVYQVAVDIDAVSGGNWARLGRAAGSLVDANASGMLMVCWAFGLTALRSHVEPPWRWACTIGAAVAVGGVWASGSRSALAAGIIALVGIVIFVGRRAIWRRWLSPRAAVGAVIAVVLSLGVLVWLAAQASGANPVRRLLYTDGTGWMDAASVRTVLVEAWDRNGYGTAAMGVVRDSPLVGGGVGSFHVVGPDYAARAGYGLVEPDNAQNWYRHQLAEMGYVGSIGWIAWVGLFLPMVIRPPGHAGEVMASLLVRSLIIGIGVASLVGMPTQNPAVALTFWTMVFWYSLSVDSPLMQPGGSRTTRRGLVAGAWILALAHLTGTAYAATTDLRVPYRALETGWPYVHGLSSPIIDAEGRQFRETGKRAVEVFPARDGWLKLTMWATHPDAQRNPVEVKIWRGRELVLSMVARDATQVTRYIQVPAGHEWMLIETWVERTWEPFLGYPRGLAIQAWEWVDRPPPGSAALAVAARE